jgi:LAGLIDADG-like domain
VSVPPAASDAETLHRLYVDELLTTAQIAARLQCGASTVRRRLHQFAIPVRRRGPKTAGFRGRDPEWSPEIAWIVGLIATDGNLSKTRSGITLTSKDLDLLEGVRRCLSLSNSIGRSEGGLGTGVRRLQWRSRTLYAWLRNIGLTPRKSLTLGPLAVPDACFADFLRSCIDGDGTVLAYTDRYHTAKKASYVYQRLYVSLVSASRPFVDWIEATIHRLRGVRGGVHEKRRRDRARTAWVLRCSKKASVQLLAWMYYAPDVVCLARKRAKAAPFMIGGNEGILSLRAGVSELVDDADSKSAARKGVGVRVPSPAPPLP